MKFLQPQIQMSTGIHIPYFKINPLFFWCTLFFKEYLKPQVKINKMVNEYAATINLKNTSSLVSIDSSGLYLSLQSIYRVFSQTCISHHD